MNIDVHEMAFVGDEEKDIVCAVNAGVITEWTNERVWWMTNGQGIRRNDLKELLELYLFLHEKAVPEMTEH